MSLVNPLFPNNNKVVWDDLRFPVDAVRSVSGKVPADVSYQNGLVLGFVNTSDNAITFNIQLNHGAKFGQDLDSHIHIILPVAGAGGGVENIKFDWTYSWAGIGGVFPAYSTMSATLDVQNRAADTHILFDIGDMLYSNRAAGADGVSDMIICRLTRDVSVANNYGSSVYLMESDIHVQIDSVGSRQEAVK